MRRNAEKAKAPALVHRDLDLVQRILRDQLSEDFTRFASIRKTNIKCPRVCESHAAAHGEEVKLYTRDAPILEAYGVQAEIDKAIKPRVWLKSGVISSSIKQKRWCRST